MGAAQAGPLGRPLALRLPVPRLLRLRWAVVPEELREGAPLEVDQELAEERHRRPGPAPRQEPGPRRPAALPQGHQQEARRGPGPVPPQGFLAERGAAAAEDRRREPLCAAVGGYQRLRQAVLRGQARLLRELPAVEEPL